MKNETEERLRLLMAKVFGLPSPDLAGEVTRVDGGVWDSLRHVELIFAVEDAFRVRFTEEDFAAIQNLADLVTRVGQLRASASVAV